MIKYYIQTLKGTTSILEVEVRPITQLEDPSLAWSLKPGEAVYHVIRPKSLAGERWMSFAFHDSEAEARAHLERMIREVEMPRALRQGGTPMTEEEVQEKLTAVKLQPID